MLCILNLIIILPFLRQGAEMEQSAGKLHFNLPTKWRWFLAEYYYITRSFELKKLTLNITVTPNANPNPYP